jgi:P4 family phage/plasmid primase-like protien
MKLPKQLQDKRFRFIKIITGTKKPVEEDWNMTYNYKHDDPEFVKYLKTAKAYGVACRFGKLAIIDCDEKEVASDIFMKLPNTFTVKTGSGGTHFYYIIEGLRDKIILTDDDKKHWGEVQFTGAYALGAGSLHPNKNYYEVLQDNKIETITKVQLDEVIEPYIKTKKVFICNSGINFSIEGIAKSIKGLDLNGKGELQGVHPTHGSKKGEKGTNISIDVENNKWHCFRCGTGGDAIALVGVLEGIVDCSDCTKGFWKEHPKEFKETLKVAEKKYSYVPSEKPEKYQKKNGLILFRNKILNTEAIVAYIMKNYEFVTIKDSASKTPYIYLYQDGKYSLEGRTELEKIIKGIFKGSAWSVHYKNEIMDYIKTEKVKDRDEINPPKHLINVNNGIFNLKTGELEKHSSKYYFLYKIPINYKKTAKMVKIKKYFESTLKKEYITLSQEIFGYCLYFDYPISCIMYLYGSGGNGKSVWIHLLTSMLGKGNFSSKEISNLMINQFATSGLYGKLANVCGEMSPGVMKNTDMLKRLSAGDYIDAEFKGRDAFTFPNKAKIITACNDIPECKDATDGWFQRQYVLPFLKKFRRTPEDNTKLKYQLVANKAEMEGLLLWSLQGLKRLIDNERFSYEYDMEERYTMYQKNCNFFIDSNYIKKGYDDFIKVNDIREQYVKWCEKNDVPIANSTLLARKLDKDEHTLDRIQDEKRNWVWIRRYIQEV